jgi:hypothetical protein
MRASGTASAATGIWFPYQYNDKIINTERPCLNFGWTVLNARKSLSVLVLGGNLGKVVAALTVDGVVKARVIRLQILTGPEYTTRKDVEIANATGEPRGIAGVGVVVQNGGDLGNLRQLRNTVRK